MLSVSAAVTDLESELSRLRNENDSLSKTVALQDEHLKQLQNEMTKLRKERTLMVEAQKMELDRMSFERNVAITKADRVVSLIEGIGKMALEGVQTMREDVSQRSIASAIIEAGRDMRIPQIGLS